MTKKQRELLNFIQRFTAQQGYSPSFREIMSGLGYKSVSTVAIHVENLILLGHVKKKDNSARSLEVVKPNQHNTETPKHYSSHEKWIIDNIDIRFQKIDDSNRVPKKIVDELFVLVGALAILAGRENAVKYKQRLKKFI